MPMIRNFDEAREALRPYYFAYSTQDITEGYKLDRMHALLDHIGNPQESLRVLHIAGTSGKSSTAYYASALLEQTGASVGLTVSPHVVEMNDRVQINHVPLAEVDFCNALGAFIDIVQSSGIHPSYFELMIALAYYEFAKRGVDYAVVEVGLGGLHDCTNVVKRADKVCVITDIGLDHTNVLGDTLEAIAAQKAGIMQPGSQAFIYEQAPNVMGVMRATARRVGALLHEIDPAAIAAIDGVHLPNFQQRNFGLALQTVEYVLARDGRPALTLKQIAEAAQVRIPGRLEIFHVGRKIVVVDGAHNQQKMSALAESMRQLFGDKPVAALVGMVANRDEKRFQALDVLGGYASNTIATAFIEESDEMPKHAAPPEEIAAYLRSRGHTCAVEPNYTRAYTQLLECPEPILLITGSLYLFSNIRPLIHEH